MQMLEEWYLNSSPLGCSPSSLHSAKQSLPFDTFDVKQADRQLSMFMESSNKSRDGFSELMKLNGLATKEVDHLGAVA